MLEKIYHITASLCLIIITVVICMNVSTLQDMSKTIYQTAGYASECESELEIIKDNLTGYYLNDFGN